jgi:hypothetical protein
MRYFLVILHSIPPPPPDHLLTNLPKSSRCHIIKKTHEDYKNVAKLRKATLHAFILYYRKLTVNSINVALDSVRPKANLVRRNVYFLQRSVYMITLTNYCYSRGTRLRLVGFVK